MKASRLRRIVFGVVLGFLVASAQQQYDPNFHPTIAKPAYAEDQGPLVSVDGGHYNFHTVEGRYKPFAELLRRDGYVVRGANTPFSAESLADAGILVICNALAERNRKEENWVLPTPSAFTDAEIRTVRDWVGRGGSLLFIADHMPFPGAAEKLASAFGVHFSNGLVGQGPDLDATITFRRADGGLADQSITRGREASEWVEFVRAFGGSAFQAPEHARPLLVLDETAITFTPQRAGDFGPDSPHHPVGGWLQGAVLRVGSGRVAVFGEAGMFTAQVAGPHRAPFGMNSPEASQNAQFLLNVMHWLSGLLPD
jgi:hypothetical protein